MRTMIRSRLRSYALGIYVPMRYLHALYVFKERSCLAL